MEGTPITLMERYSGCLIGGAAGDALGYPIEFMDRDSIRGRYGQDGIAELPEGAAVQISDDTQMTVLTAVGIIDASKAPDAAPEAYVDSVYRLYRRWAELQGFELKEAGGVADSEVLGNRWMTERRAPGGTCIGQLTSSASPGTIDRPANDSKGCGAVMRTAPVPLLMRSVPISKVIRTSAGIAASTHGHPLGWMTAALVSTMIWHELRGDSVGEAVSWSLEEIRTAFPDSNAWPELNAVVQNAVMLADSVTPDAEAMARLGEGWVAEETAAMAVFACIRHENDFGAAIRAAVNITGDSDSVGAVAGNILGARLGIGAVDSAFDTRRLECDAAVRRLAADLLQASGRLRREL